MDQYDDYMPQRDDTGYTSGKFSSYTRMQRNTGQKKGAKKKTLTEIHFESIAQDERPYSPPFEQVFKDS